MLARDAVFPQLVGRAEVSRNGAPLVEGRGEHLSALEKTDPNVRWCENNGGEGTYDWIISFLDTSSRELEMIRQLENSPWERRRCFEPSSVGGLEFLVDEPVSNLWDMTLAFLPVLR